MLAKRSLFRLEGIGAVLEAGGWRFLAATGLVSAANLAFHPVVARVLTPDQYGGVAAILALLSLFAAPAMALQMVVARAIEHQRRLGLGDLPSSIERLFAQTLIFGSALGLVIALLGPLVSSFFHLDSEVPVWLVGAYAVTVSATLVPRALLLGERRYRSVWIAVLTGATVRFVFAVLLPDSAAVEGAIAATVLGEVVTAFLLFPSARKVIRASTSPSPIQVNWSDATGIVVAMTGFWLLATVHILLGRHYLNAEESPTFLVAAIIAQSALYVASAISVVMVPKLVAVRNHLRQLRRLFVGTLRVVGLLGAFLALVLGAFGESILQFVFGDAYRGDGASSTVLLLLALAAAVMGMIYTAAQYHLTRRSRVGAALPWLGAIMLGVLLIPWHGSSEVIALLTLIVAITTLVGMLLPALADHEVSSFEELVNKEEWESGIPTLDLTIVVPFFNPGPAVQKQVARIQEVLRDSSVSYEIIAVSDGSTDGSEAHLERFDEGIVRRVRLHQNTGKGEALRVGLGLGRGQYLGFIDADGDIDPVHLGSYLQLVQMYEPDIIMGSKRHPMSEVSYPPLRVMYSWGYHALVHFFFRLRIRDTQTGLKLIRRDVLVRVLPRMLEKRFAFDLELLVVARHVGYDRFFEAPIRVEHQFTSTVSWKTTLGMLNDTIAIWYRLHVLRQYDDPGLAPSLSYTEEEL